MSLPTTTQPTTIQSNVTESLNHPLLLKVETIARLAGQTIVLPAFQNQTSSQQEKNDGSIVTETDELCQAHLQKALAELDPTIGFLGEEMTTSEQLAALHSGQKFWCVDPIDGTSNFATPMPFFAISIALIEHGKPIVACIYDPVRDEMFSAFSDSGLFINHTKQDISHHLKPLRESVGFIDFKRLQPALAAHLVTRSPYRSQRNLGTCALEWAWLAAGRSQFVVHGGQKLWDYAAGLLLAEESGCVVTDFAGNHPFAQAKLSCPILATTSKQLSEAWLNITNVDETP